MKRNFNNDYEEEKIADKNDLKNVSIEYLY